MSDNERDALVLPAALLLLRSLVEWTRLPRDLILRVRRARADTAGRCLAVLTLNAACRGRLRLRRSLKDFSSAKVREGDEWREGRVEGAHGLVLRAEFLVALGRRRRHEAEGENPRGDNAAARDEGEHGLERMMGCGSVW